MTRAAVLLALFLALPATAVAQAPPECPPGVAFDDVTLTSQERGQDAKLVATHEVDVTADVRGEATAVTLTPQDGVAVLKKNSSGTIVIFAPSTPNLSVTVSWRQSIDPSNRDEEGRCSASRVATLPVLPANPARGVKQPNPGPPSGDYTFAIAAAEAKRADLRPLEVSIRSTGHARFPKANERLRTWVVPMRNAEQVNYHKSLPNPAYATTAQMCRFWWMTCGPTFAELASLNYDDRALNRGIERPDLDGSNAILRGLAYTQPSRWASPLGIVISARPGAARPQPYGYDVQVRQAGRLLARVRRAGRCVTVHRSSGLFDKCPAPRSSTLLR
ncbi:MAG TPA: hypothetical protein VK486_13280 [Thermoleophilaceae bacterium]|nr:hypothetical protein [Thermoleophilaceae bacterium]